MSGPLPGLPPSLIQPRPFNPVASPQKAPRATPAPRVLPHVASVRWGRQPSWSRSIRWPAPRPAPAYLAGVVQTGAAAAELGGRGADGGEGHGLLGQEGGGVLDQGRGVSEGRAQAPLLAQDLLVGHGVDGMGEGEGWAAEKSREVVERRRGRGDQGSVRPVLPGQRRPCPGIGWACAHLTITRLCLTPNQQWLSTVPSQA